MPQFQLFYPNGEQDLTPEEKAFIKSIIRRQILAAMKQEERIRKYSYLSRLELHEPNMLITTEN